MLSLGIKTGNLKRFHMYLEQDKRCKVVIWWFAGIGTEPTKAPPTRDLKEHVSVMKETHPAFQEDTDTQ